ncbi:MAG: helix-turn-helix domain-containing protein [Candidatus Cloacimonetes bacterium]|nr:helix-turn-helix domain-containing protein [Candidatus Cloacimonadota bacterium]
MQKLDLWKTLKTMKVSDQEISKLLRVSRATLYRWQKRMKEKGPKGLEEKKSQTASGTQPNMVGNRPVRSRDRIMRRIPGMGKGQDRSSTETPRSENVQLHSREDTGGFETTRGTA